MKKYLLLLPLLALIGAGCANSATKNTTSTAQTPDTGTSNPATATTYQSVQLASSIQARLPSTWKLTSKEETPPFKDSTVDLAGGSLSVRIIDAEAWAKSANPGYAIPRASREKALSILQNVYTRQSITADDRKQFDALAGEFLGYTLKDRAALTYIANEDSRLRGFTFYNLRGQNIGVAPVYYVVLYNLDKKTVIYGTYTVPATSKEVTDTNAPLQAATSTSGTAYQQLDTRAHEAFKALVETGPRSNLSFGATLDAIDLFFRSMSLR